MVIAFQMSGTFTLVPFHLLAQKTPDFPSLKRGAGYLLRTVSQAPRLVQSIQHEPTPLLVDHLRASGGSDSSPASSSADGPPAVTVNGVGEVQGTPDTLTAQIGVETQAADVTAAIAQANSSVRTVTDAVVVVRVPLTVGWVRASPPVSVT